MRPGEDLPDRAEVQAQNPSAQPIMRAHPWHPVKTTGMPLRLSHPLATIRLEIKSPSYERTHPMTNVTRILMVPGEKPFGGGRGGYIPFRPRPTPPTGTAASIKDQIPEEAASLQATLKVADCKSAPDLSESAPNSCTENPLSEKPQVRPQAPGNTPEI